jgi:hypothetical protein
MSRRRSADKELPAASSKSQIEDQIPSSKMEDGAKLRDLEDRNLLMRVKICRKELKESRLFLRLVDAGLAKSNVVVREALAAEARELTLIFSSIISKSR